MIYVLITRSKVKSIHIRFLSLIELKLISVKAIIEVTKKAHQ